MLKNIKWALVVLCASSLISCEKEEENKQLREREQDLITWFVSEYEKLHNVTIEPDSEGFYYQLVTEGDGVKPYAGLDDVTKAYDTCVLVRYTARRIFQNPLYTENTIFSTSVRSTSGSAELMYNIKPIYPLSDTVKLFLRRPNTLIANAPAVNTTGFIKALENTREGGKTIVFFPSLYGFGALESGGLNAYSPLWYEFELIKVISNPHQDDKAQVLVKLAELNIDPADSLVGSGGCYRQETVAGSGLQADSSTNLKVQYKLYLLDGKNTLVESNDSLKFEMYPSTASYIAGWYPSFYQLKSGSEGNIIIPYTKAYGQAGSLTQSNQITIPPYTSLLYEYKLLSVAAKDTVK